MDRRQDESRARAGLIVTQRGVIYPWQCDHMGHLNVMGYVGKFDEATWQMFAAMGLTPSYQREHGLGIAAVRQEIAYRRELTAGSVISIYTGILELRDKRIRFYHEMWNDDSGEVAAATVITGVLLDSASRKVRTIPAEIIEQGQKLIVTVQPLV